MSARVKFCHGCQQAKPLDEFGGHKRTGDGKQSRCKPCSKLYKVYTKEERAALAAGATVTVKAYTARRIAQAKKDLEELGSRSR